MLRLAVYRLAVVGILVLLLVRDLTFRLPFIPPQLLGAPRVNAGTNRLVVSPTWSQRREFSGGVIFAHTAVDILTMSQGLSQLGLSVSDF